MSALARSTAQIAAAAASLTLLVAVAVRVSGADHAARSELALSFPGPTARPGDVAAIAAHNGRYAAAALLGCVAVTLAPPARPLLDVALCALLCLNAVVIGLGWGAYGTQLARALALHGPVELAAFALCGAAYLRARRGLLPTRQLALVSIAATLLLAAAAGLEAYVSLEEAP